MWFQPCGYVNSMGDKYTQPCPDYRGKCIVKSTTQTFHCPILCREYTCADGRCVEDYRECDKCFGKETCDNGNCYSQWERCDGYNSCADWSDERDCPLRPGAISAVCAASLAILLILLLFYWCYHRGKKHVKYDVSGADTRFQEEKVMCPLDDDDIKVLSVVGSGGLNSGHDRPDSLVPLLKKVKQHSAPCKSHTVDLGDGQSPVMVAPVKSPIIASSPTYGMRITSSGDDSPIISGRSLSSKSPTITTSSYGRRIRVLDDDEPLLASSSKPHVNGTASGGMRIQILENKPLVTLPVSSVKAPALIPSTEGIRIRLLDVQPDVKVIYTSARSPVSVSPPDSTGRSKSPSGMGGSASGLRLSNCGGESPIMMPPIVTKPPQVTSSQIYGTRVCDQFSPIPESPTPVNTPVSLSLPPFSLTLEDDLDDDSTRVTPTFVKTTAAITPTTILTTRGKSPIMVAPIIGMPDPERESPILLSQKRGKSSQSQTSVETSDSETSLKTPASPNTSSKSLTSVTPNTSAKSLTPVTPNTSAKSLTPVTPNTSAKSLMPVSPNMGAKTLTPMTPIMGTKTLTPVTPDTSAKPLTPVTPTSILVTKGKSSIVVAPTNGIRVSDCSGDSPIMLAHNVDRSPNAVESTLMKSDPILPSDVQSIRRPSDPPKIEAAKQGKSTTVVSPTATKPSTSLTLSPILITRTKSAPEPPSPGKKMAVAQEGGKMEEHDRIWIKHLDQPRKKSSPSIPAIEREYIEERTSQV